MIPVEPTAEYPIPFDLTDEQPRTHSDGVAVTINTVEMLEQLGGNIDFADKDLHKAKALIMGEQKPNAPKFVASAAEAKAAHALIKRFDYNAFSDALQARNFITNKLVSLADCGDPKLELKALELLGKHSDIGLFTERSEVTVHHTTSTALENSIKDRIKRLLNTDVTDITPLDDLDAQLGPAEPFEAFKKVVEEDRDIDPEDPDGEPKVSND
jgi:hypothetical protein